MKQFLVFVRKEFLHVFRDRKTLLLLFGLPIVQILLFGFALSNEIKDSKIVVCDYARDNASRAIIEKIKASTNFVIKEDLLNHNQIEAAFKKGDVKLAVVFPSNFNYDLLHNNHANIQTIADGSDPNTASTLTSYITRIVGDFQADQNEEAIPNYTIHTETRMVYNPELKGSTNFVPGVIALVLLLVCVLMTSVSIVKEKENGTMEILLVSPFNPLLVILSKAVPYLLLSIINLAVIFILSATLLDLPIKGSLLLLTLISIIFIITALSLGLLISNLTNSQQSAMLISLMGMLVPTILLSGFMFPIANMPVFLQWISNIIPSKWYYTIAKFIMVKGLGFRYIWKETLVLIGMTIFLLFVSLKKFKIRLQ